MHSLPAEVVQPQLGDIVRGLIGCLSAHRVLKVRSLLYRLVLAAKIGNLGQDPTYS